MAIEDTARLLSPKRPAIALKILQCFYKTDEGVTKAKLLQQTGLKPKTLEYYISLFRRWKLLETHRRKGAPCHYTLSFAAFHSHVDSIYCDPIKTLGGSR